MLSPTGIDGKTKLWLGLALVLAGAAACSADPLMPSGSGGSQAGSTGQGGGGGTTGVAGTTGTGGWMSGGCDGLPVPAIGCAVGPTVPVCASDGNGNSVWKITCPEDPTGAAGAGGGLGGAGGGLGGAGGAAGTNGAAGAGGAGTAGRGGASGAGGAPCASTSQCAAGEICTVEDGDCKAAPGCGPNVACPAVCYGNCRAADGESCGSTRCGAGTVCCNASCGTCTPPNGGCTKQICAAGICTTDADCRAEADYCTGCDCRALSRNQSLKACPGPGVRCLLDPCSGKKAACVGGQCVIQ